MFFKDFMQEVVAIEAAGAFDNLAKAEEVAEGEEVVGTIADNPYLKALCTACENRARAHKEEVLKMTEENDIRLADEKFQAIADIVCTELSLHFNHLEGAMSLRKGWIIAKQPMLEPQIRRLAFPLDALLALSDLSDCGDPLCPIHGRASKGRQRNPRAEA